jgi:hypothetical protein
MALTVPDLDDRRFDDLVAELEARLRRQLPELTQLAPGDPLHALVDLFAWLGETVIYRANRIPERQRLAFLDLLRIPRRPARPATGLVCLDAVPGDAVALPPPLPPESALRAGEVTFTTRGELQATPLELSVLVKRALDPAALEADGITLEQLRDQYGGLEPAAFRPTVLAPGRDRVTTAGTVDGALYLALALPRALAPRAERWRRALAGTVLQLGLAPDAEVDGDLAAGLAARRLDWDLAWWRDPAGAPTAVEYLPLEVVDDGSRGARRAGVVRLRLPANPDVWKPAGRPDPQYAGVGDAPPEAPDGAGGGPLFWLRVRSRDGDALELGWLGVNAVEVVGQGVVRDAVLGLGTGQPDQALRLDHRDVAEVRIEVEELRRFEPWREVPQLLGCGPDERVYTVDAADGVVRFGDGVRGRRPAAGARVRAASYRHGGGAAGNLPADAIQALAGASRLKVRHEWPTRGGVDAEPVAEAERRIPAVLAHRERAVTADDFAALARDNPARPVARADAVPGFLPGASLTALRRGVPGVVSVFVLPPGEPALGAAPRPTAGMLRDVYEDLSARTLVGTELYVLAPQYQRLSLALSLEVTDPTAEAQVHRAVERALVRYLWPLAPHGFRGGGWPRGRAVERNELRTQAGRVDGVEAVNALRLFHEDPATGRWAELTGSDALPLADYQLPELVEVALHGGEAQPPPPRGGAPGPAGGGGPGAPGRPVPVPVIPDLC